MPKLRGRGKGKKGKRKGKKKKRKPQVEPEPPPLHDLTVLYDQLYDATVRLYEMRIAARKKRLETWFLMMQINESKLNNQIFKDYIEGKLNDLQEIIDELLKKIQDEKDSIAEAIRKLTEEMNKKIKDMNDKTAQLEVELAEVNLQLEEFLPLMAELQKLLEQLEAIKKEIEAARIDANRKTRHLINQFLLERGKLHHHLEEQLCLLIRHCRTYLIPILWTFMQRMIARNACARFKLARADEKNIFLDEKRAELNHKRKLLMLEQPYWGVQWAIHKMVETSGRKKAKKKMPRKEAEILGIKAELVGKTDQEMAQIAIGGGPSTFQVGGSAGTSLGRDFGKFLLQRLTALIAAKARAEKTKKIVKKRIVKIVVDTAAEDEEEGEAVASADTDQFYRDEDKGDFDWEDLNQYGDLSGADESEEESAWVTSGEEEVVTEAESEEGGLENDEVEEHHELN